MSNLVSKITFKSVVGAVKTEPFTFTGEDGKEKTVARGVEGLFMRVAGIIRDTRHVQSAYGDSTEFQGEIRAINLETGEEFNSGKMFLPQIAESFTFNAFESAKTQDGFQGLTVAFDIGIKPAATPMGYEYTVRPLIERKTNDVLGELLDSLPALALPSPNAVETKSAKPSNQSKPE